MSDLHILAINPGSTTIKLALFRNDAQLASGTVPHGTVTQEAIQAWLDDNGHGVQRLDAVVGRGGLLPPLQSGTYAVNQAMLDDLHAARRGQHASNMGGIIAHAIAARAGCPAFIVDPVSVDELIPEARISGFAGIERESLSHALNSKAVAKRYARECGRPYEQLNLVVAHLGSGISVSAHLHGRMIDVNNSREEGPFSAERCGSVPVLALVCKAIREKWTEQQAERKLFCEGGVFSYLGTHDVANILDRDDEETRLVLRAMLHQIIKEVGAMAAVLDGQVDAVLITGGMAHAGVIAQELERRLRWIAPVRVYPGEDELRALAEGALRVLRGAEAARSYA